MVAQNHSAQFKISVTLEVDTQLLRLADRMGIGLADLLEEVLRSKITSGEPDDIPLSVSDIRISSLYQCLTSQYTSRPMGLRHCFREQ